MNNFFSINKLVAVKPLPIVGAKKKVVGGMVVLAQSVEMVETELLFDAEISSGEFYLKGSKVLFLATDEKAEWNKNAYTFQEKSFVLAPIEKIIMISPPDFSAEQEEQK